MGTLLSLDYDLLEQKDFLLDFVLWPEVYIQLKASTAVPLFSNSSFSLVGARPEGVWVSFLMTRLSSSLQMRTIYVENAVFLNKKICPVSQKYAPNPLILYQAISLFRIARV